MKKFTKKLLEYMEGKPTVGDQFYYKTKAKKIDTTTPSSKWPKSWKTIHYKTYPRFRAFTISKEKAYKTPLDKIIKRRESAGSFTGEKMQFDDFFSLMQNAAGITYKGSSVNESKRAYPSGGARYPLELYAIALKITDLDPGLYHYNVKENLIELMYAKKLNSEIQEIFCQLPWIEKASAIFFITGIPKRSTIKYGDRGHRFMYIETGLLAQNLLLLATELGYGTCLIGGFVEDEVIKLLDIMLQEEYPLLSVVLGKTK